MFDALAGRYDLAVRGYRRAVALERARGARTGVALDARRPFSRAHPEVMYISTKLNLGG